MTAEPVADLSVLTGRLQDACGLNPGPLCRSVYDTTHSKGLAGFASIALTKPLHIVVIVAVAVAVRAIVFRAIAKITSSADEGRLPTGLRPLGARARARFLDNSPLLYERRQQRAETIASVLRSIASFTVFGIAFVMILGELGLNLAPIVASAGIVGVAVGFGAQNLVRDFLTGMFMILEDQYGVGDVIDVGPASGSVEAVGLRTSRLRDVNGVVWHIRNGEIARVGNKSQGWSRALLDIPVAYHADIAQVRSVVKAAADTVWNDPGYSSVVLEEPEVWGVEAFEANHLVLRLVVKTAPLKQWDVARVLRERVKGAFDENGLEIPFPQRSIWVRASGDDQPQVGVSVSAAPKATDGEESPEQARPESSTGPQPAAPEGEGGQPS